MKLYVEFKRFEVRDNYIEELKKKGFETSINSFGTLLIKIEFMSFNKDLDALSIENKLRTANIKLEDINYFEVQRGE